MPKSFRVKTIKKLCSQNFQRKIKIAALCCERVFCIFRFELFSEKMKIGHFENVQK